MPRIKLIGNDIEIDGQKVARVLDIYPTLRSDLEDFINKADGYKDLDNEVEDLNKKLATTVADANEAYEDGKIDGYAEGKEDANSN
jgi:hypothetical protein